MSMRPRLLMVLTCAVLAGCWDFIEPEFAAENAAAIIQINASIDEHGNLNLSGLLVPGLDEHGFVREVTRDTLYVFGMAVPSDTVLPSGSRVYRLNASLGPGILLQPFTIDPPRLAGIPIEPTVRWYSPRPLDPDTLRIARGSELLLRIALDPNTPLPVPAQQWFLELSGRETRYQISANGAPPPLLRIPPEFIPEPADSVVRVALTTFQSAQPFTGLYRGAFSYSVRMDWTVILQ